MSKVFKIGQDLRESEYLISLWMKLLIKVENAQRTGNVEPSILTHVRTLIRTLSGSHQHFLASKKDAEKQYVKQTLARETVKGGAAKQALSIESLSATIENSFKAKQLRSCLKLILLLVLKIDALAEGDQKTKKIHDILAFIQDSPHFKKSASLLKDLLSELSEIEKSLPLRECEILLGILLNWSVRSDVQPFQAVFSNRIYTIAAHYLIEDQKDLLLALENTKPISEPLRIVIASALKLKAGIKIADQELSALKTLTQKVLITYPHSQRIRSLYNNISIYLKNFDGLVLLKDEDGKVLPLEFGSDRRFQELFRLGNPPSSGGTFSKRSNPLKLAILQSPQRPFSKQALQFLNNQCKEVTSSSAPIVAPDGNLIYAFCVKQKNIILTSQFGYKSDGKLRIQPENTNLFVKTLNIWKKGGNSDMAKQKSIKILASIDNLLLLTLICYPPAHFSQEELESQTARAAQLVLDNTVLDTIYFTTYLFYLYFIKDNEQLMQWIDAMTFLRCKPEVEYFGHFSHMMQRMKDLQSGVDDSEDNKEMISEISKHLSECSIDHIRDAAEFAQLMVSKHILKDRGIAEISQGVAKLIETNPEKYKPLFAAILNKPAS